jgi:hypothetical protein
MITRRNALQRISLGAGGALLAPILSELQANAEGKAPPKRFVFFVQTQGLQSWAVKPPEVERKEKRDSQSAIYIGVDQTVVRPMKPLSLAQDLEPLAKFKDRLTIVQGLNGTHVSPYHGGPYGALGGFRQGDTAHGQTIDCALGKALPAIFPMVGLGVGRYEGITNVAYCSSAWGANQHAPILCSADYAYKVLFGSVLQGTERTEFDARTDLLAFMKDDVKRVQSRLAGPEREKFDAYVAAYENMHVRQSQLAQASERLRKVAPAKNEKFTSVIEATQLEAQIELAAAALIGGLTRVATITSGLCRSDGMFQGFSKDPISLHGDMGHKQGSEGGMALYSLVRKAHLAQVAALAERLQAVPEGNGTMLDNTVIVYTSDFGERHHSTGYDWAYVLVGNAGGALKSNLYIDYPLNGKKGGRSINAFYCTLLHAAGDKRAHFNLDGARKSIDEPGPLSELLA